MQNTYSITVTEWNIGHSFKVKLINIDDDDDVIYTRFHKKSTTETNIPKEVDIILNRIDIYDKLQVAILNEAQLSHSGIIINEGWLLQDVKLTGEVILAVL